MMLYTWKDIERELLLNKDKWQGVIFDSEIYTDEIIIHLKKGKTEEDAKRILRGIFGINTMARKYYWIYRLNT